MHLISDGNCLLKTIQRLLTAIFQWGLHNIQLETTTLLSSPKRVHLKSDGNCLVSTTNNNHEVRVTQHSLGDYTSALAYEKCSLDITLRLFGKKHPTTTYSYHSVGVTQHSLADYKLSALKSKKRALYIR